MNLIATSVSWLFAGVCMTSAGHWIYSAWLLARRFEALPVKASPQEREIPAVSFLKPLKRGVPDLEAKLGALVKCLRPDDQIVFGVDAGSEEETLCLRLCARHSDRRLDVVSCRPGVAPNPKISKLLQMQPLLRHDHCILSDAELVLEDGWMDAFRREWIESGCDALTAGYRFVGAGTVVQKLDVLPAMLFLWPGLAVVERHGTFDLTLGACTAFRRSDVDALGGWRRFAECLAEDRELGRALHRSGRRIRLSRRIASLGCDPLGWKEWWDHQRRVAVTYRVGSPAGFAASVTTHGESAALGLLVMPGGGSSAIWALLGVIAVRLATARWLAEVTGQRGGLWPWSPMMGLVQSAGWAFSWAIRKIRWAGRTWIVSREGRLTAPDMGKSEIRAGE